MVSLNNLRSPKGARNSSKRVGRGNGSGKGTYSTRGCKGQNSRSGGGVPAWFEGGQTPLFRRTPKFKGFSNAIFKKEIAIINLSDLVKLSEKGINEITVEKLKEIGFLRKSDTTLKLLAKGEITSAVTISVHKASPKALEAVKNAGGTVNILV